MSRFDPHKPVPQSCRKHHFFMPYAFWSEYNSQYQKEYYVLAWTCVTCDATRYEEIDVTTWDIDSKETWRNQAESQGFRNQFIPF